MLQVSSAVCFLVFLCRSGISAEGSEYVKFIRADGDACNETTPGIVTDLIATTEGNVITLTWNAPEDDPCITGYQISYLEYHVSTVYTTFAFPDLDYCTTYDFHVSAASNYTTGDPAEISVELSTPENIGPVRNLELTVVEKILNATWLPPEYAANCVAKYMLVMWNQNENQKDFESEETYYEFSPLIGCMTYNVQVKPWVNQSKEGQSTFLSTEVGDLTTEPPKNLALHVYDTWALLTWQLESYKENMCEIYQVRVECTALPEDNDDLDWIVDYVEAIENITDGITTRPPVAVNVTEMSEWTNYTCYGFIVNSGGDSNYSQPVTFQTNEGVPSEPLSVIITDANSTSIDVLWEEPHKIPGILTHYDVTFEPINPMNYVPEECKRNVSEKKFTVAVDERSYVFEEAFPDFLYYVRVSASTRVGDGPEKYAEAVTLTSVPEIPRELAYTWIIEQIVDYNVTAVLSWMLPCNTNGVLEYFEVLVNGSSSEEATDDYYGNFTVKANDPIVEIDYELQIPDIKPAFMYTASVRAILDDGTEGEVAFIELNSPDGYPSSPNIINVFDLTESGFSITWTEPDIKNGPLLTYNVTIQSNGPLYPVPTDCDEPNLSTFWYEVNSEIMSYDFDELQPYYNYTVSVSAATSVGYGFPASIIVIALETTPEKPRNLKATLKVEDLVEYKAEAMVTWDLPCKTNGELDHFLISINYTDLNSESYLLETVLDPTDDLTYVLPYTYLEGGFTYIFTVKAILSSELEGEEDLVEIEAPEGYPGAPLLDETLDPNSDFFEIIWEEPAVKNGLLRNYSVTVACSGPLYEVPDDSECQIDTNFYEYILDASIQSFNFTQAKPYHFYEIRVKTTTSIGYGPESNTVNVTTDTAEPEVVRSLSFKLEADHSEMYNANVSVTFQPPCNTYGVFESYNMELIGSRVNHEDHWMNGSYVNATDVFIGDLRAEYNYTLHVIVKTETYQSAVKEVEFQTPPGVPPASDVTILEPLVSAGTAEFTLTYPLFDEENGDILYYAFIVSASENISSVYGFWDGTAQTWPGVTKTSKSDVSEPYQATPMFWNPFAEGADTNVSVILGTGDCYDGGFCNYKLEPNTTYIVMIRGFTSSAFRDSQPFPFDSFNPTPRVNTILIIIVVCSVLAALLLAALTFAVWRRRNKKISPKSSILSDDNLPKPVPVSRFPEHYNDYRLNYNKLKVEYTLLGSKTAEIEMTKQAAVLPENRSKNRYTNILPFDETRVILTSDANENNSSYINASYIKGFSGEKEYIATQGPLQSTCLDFWRMVLQENVTVIAMVAHFIEQNKDKCFKYFPPKNENMTVGEGIEVRCTSEVNFETYIQRTFLIQKETEKQVVAHLQFTGWPDFGCPNSTSSMLLYCQLLRKKQKETGGMIVVHCSAGVGRSGTLIAIDILLQAIDARKDINVFNTVLDLRRQRENMVQTEKQYMFIFTCIKDAIERPQSITAHPEPIYENIINGNCESKEQSESIS